MNAEFKRMMELAGLTEIKINKPNPINLINHYKSQVISTPQTRDKLDLTIKCIKSILYLFEDVYPDNNSPRKAIEAAEECIYDPNDETLDNAYKAYEDNDANYRANQLDRDDANNKQEAAAIISAEAGWIAYQAQAYTNSPTPPDQRKSYYLEVINKECVQILDNLIKAVKIYFNI